MPKRTEEPQKKHGDVMEPLIDETGDTRDQRGAKASDEDEELDFERDPLDPDPEDDDEDE